MWKTYCVRFFIVVNPNPSEIRAGLVINQKTHFADQMKYEKENIFQQSF